MRETARSRVGDITIKQYPDSDTRHSEGVTPPAPRLSAGMVVHKTLGASRAALQVDGTSRAL
eukprot:1059306-Prymnesium_polylepis.1